jgi:hypothetical protein
MYRIFPFLRTVTVQAVMGNLRDASNDLNDFGSTEADLVERLSDIRARMRDLKSEKTVDFVELGSLVEQLDANEGQRLRVLAKRLLAMPNATVVSILQNRVFVMLLFEIEIL